MILITETSDQKRQRGHTLSTCTILTQALSTLCFPPASLILFRLSGLVATGPTLYFLHYFLFSPKSPSFPTWRLQLFCVFLRFFSSLPPSPILSSFPSRYPRSPFPSPLLCPRFRPRSRSRALSYPVFVYRPPPPFSSLCVRVYVCVCLCVCMCVCNACARICQIAHVTVLSGLVILFILCRSH